MKNVLVALLLTAAPARAAVTWEGDCALFSREAGDVPAKVCRGDFRREEYSSAAKPLRRDGRSWDLVARVSEMTKGQVTDDGSALLFTEKVADYPAYLDPATGKKQRGRKPIATGFRLSNYGPGGELRWRKACVGLGELGGVKLSSDGRVTLALLRAGWERAGKKPAFNRVLVFDAAGSRVISFPPADGICRLPSLDIAWVSRGGKFVMLPCGAPDSVYFLQPGTRYFWRPEFSYSRIVPNSSVSDENGEESARVLVYPGGDADEGDEESRVVKDLDLSEMNWVSLKYLK